MDSVDTSDIKPGHYFELLDRTHVASSYIQMALGGHPVLARHPELIESKGSGSDYFLSALVNHHAQ